MLEQFEQSIEELYQAIPADPIRQKAWDRFSTLGLPTKKTEVYRYVKLRELYGKTPVLSSGITYKSSKEVEILPLEDAVRDFGSYLKNRMLHLLQQERDPFAALNGALFQEGLFLYVPPGTRVTEPITLELYHEEDKTTVPRIFGSIGKGAEVTVVFQTKGKGNTNILFDWNVEEGAHLHLIQKVAGEGNELQAVRGTVKRNGNFKVTAATAGSPVTRLDYQFDLIGEGSSADIGSLADLKDRREAHTNVLIRHLAPHTTSNQLIKNIVRDNAHSSFEGKIYVDQIAEKTEAYQLNANLLLSEGARAESKPNLEIFNEDVKASHGATFGQLEPELLFYLQARGLSKEKAQEMLIAGFSQEVKERCPNFPL